MGFFLPTPQIIGRKCTSQVPLLLPPPMATRNPVGFHPNRFFLKNKQRNDFSTCFFANYICSFFFGPKLENCKVTRTDFCWIFFWLVHDGFMLIFALASFDLPTVGSFPVSFLRPTWPQMHRQKTIKNNSQLPEKRTGWNPKKIWLVFCIDMVCCFSFFPRDLNFRFQAVEGVGCVCVVTSTVAGWNWRHHFLCSTVGMVVSTPPQNLLVS